MKILLAQLNPTIGALTENTDAMIAIVRAHRETVDLIVFPELSICGYPPLDLVEKPNFLKYQYEEMKRTENETVGHKVAVVVGHVSGTDTIGGRKLYNSLSILKDGNLLHFYSKHLLPTYNIFDEARHFKPGETNTAITLCGEKVGFLICEDLWNDKEPNDRTYPYNPVIDLVGQGAKTIIAINASPSNVGKYEERIQVCKNICTQHNVNLAYCNQVGANDDIVFDGGSFVMNQNGHFLCHAPLFREATASCDTKNPQNATITPLSYSEDEVIFNHVVLGVKDYTRKLGFKSVVIGSSGGIDSAVMVAVGCEALGPENVYAVTMPTQYSSNGSVSDSMTLCRNYGVKLFNMPIANLFDLFHKEFHDDIIQARGKKEPMTIGLEWENVQPRLRGMALMAYSNRYGALVLSTGNKSEMAVGYCTLYGDMCGGIAPLADLYKMEVFALARYINLRAGKEMIPQVIIDKEPSAELAPGQKDTDALPPYPVLDAILRLYIEGNHMQAKELMDHTNTITRYAGTQVGIDAFDLTRKIHKMVDKVEHKRRQAPPTIRCHARAFGSGRRLPIAQKYSDFR